MEFNFLETNTKTWNDFATVDEFPINNGSIDTSPKNNASPLHNLKEKIGGNNFSSALSGTYFQPSEAHSRSPVKLPKINNNKILVSQNNFPVLNPLPTSNESFSKISMVYKDSKVLALVAKVINI